MDSSLLVKGLTMLKKIPINLLIILIPLVIRANVTEVKLLSGGSAQMRHNIEVILTNVLNEANKKYELNTSLKDIRSYFTAGAYNNFEDLIKKTEMYASEKEYQKYLITTQDGYYEVRNIKVRVQMGRTKGNPFNNLVFVFNKDGLIVNVHFALEKHHYEQIIQQGKELKDVAFREKILSFIEIYRTAYNRKDYKFIETTLSKDALIIVGHVIKSKPQEIDYYQSLSDEKIEFIRLSKTEYLNRLKKVFAKNDFVRILFDEINIERHPTIDKIYGVQLKQRWNSSTYSDEGYLFLMIDFIEMNEPIIHVRAWQPDKFHDGSTINLYDFEIIDSND